MIPAAGPDVCPYGYCRRNRKSRQFRHRRNPLKNAVLACGWENVLSRHAGKFPDCKHGFPVSVFHWFWKIPDSARPGDAECKQLLIDSIKQQMQVGETAYRFEEETSVVLVIGVNGVGKTTTVGKLAGKLKEQGKKVVIAGADTFRAAAGDQLKEWADRSGVDMIGGTEGADPGSVVYDATAAAKARNADVLLVDTAGRLHNKKNLMNELGKINKILEKEYPQAYRETLVVLDATTGQNALVQAKEFSDVAKISGIVLTKMDGTAKGGIAVAIQAELGVPVKYIGVGETIDDLQKFDPDEFVNALFDVKNKEDNDEDADAR